MPYWCLLFDPSDTFCVNLNARIAHIRRFTTRTTPPPPPHTYAGCRHSVSLFTLPSYALHTTLHNSQCVRRTAATHHKRYHFTDAIIRYCSPHLFIYLLLLIWTYFRCYLTALRSDCDQQFFVILWANSSYAGCRVCRNDKLESSVPFWCSRTNESNIATWCDSLHLSSRKNVSCHQLNIEVLIPVCWFLLHHHHQITISHQVTTTATIATSSISCVFGYRASLIN